jgi:hypothetical protein
VELSDTAIMDVVFAATARCLFSKTLDALDVRPDASYRGLDRICMRQSSGGRRLIAYA